MPALLLSSGKEIKQLHWWTAYVLIFCVVGMQHWWWADKLTRPSGRCSKVPSGHISWPRPEAKTFETRNKACPVLSGLQACRTVNTISSVRKLHKIWQK